MSDEDDLPPLRVLPLASKANGAYRGPELHAITRRHAQGAVVRDWLIDGLLDRRAVGILSGWSGVGKTHIVNDLMVSCVLGVPFAGMDVARRCGAVLFAAEGQSDVVPRWDVLMHARVNPHLQQLGLERDSDLPLHWVSEVPLLTDRDAFDTYRRVLMEVGREQRLMSGADYGGLGLVLIDTYTAAANLDENQANAAGPNQSVFNMLHRLANELDLCVMVVDHLGKDAARGTRGSNAKEASADVVLRVTGTITDDGVVSNTAMTVSKLRGGASGRKVMFTLQPVQMPIAADGRREDGVVVRWDVASSKLRDGKGPAKQNRRNTLLMRAIDAALLDAAPAQCMMIALGFHRFRAVDAGLVREKFKLSHPPTDEDGKQRSDTIKKAYNRAMRDSSQFGAIGQKTMSDGRVMVWRTDYDHGDSSEVSRSDE